MDLSLPVKIKLPDQFYESETRCGFTITEQSKMLWAVLLDLLCEFDRVCKKHNLQYTLDSGTLLGAVRHKGFIPWDNDIDVIMTRSEYNKLCQIAQTEFTHPYFWQNNQTDIGSLRRHGQLRNSETTYILTDEMCDGKPLFTFNQGVFLDVFILDEVPDDKDTLCTWCVNLQSRIDVLWELRRLYFFSGRSKWVEDAVCQEMKAFDREVSQFNGQGNKRLANMSLIPTRKESTLFPKECFKHLTETEFEGFMFPIPADYDTILTGFYGDWHKFVVGETAHGDFIQDLYKPYNCYICNDKVSYCSGGRHLLPEIISLRNDAWKELESTRQTLYKAWEEHEATKRELQEMEAKLEYVRRSTRSFKSKLKVICFMIRNLFNKKELV